MRPCQSSLACRSLQPNSCTDCPLRSPRPRQKKKIFSYPCQQTIQEPSLHLLPSLASPEQCLCSAQRQQWEDRWLPGSMRQELIMCAGPLPTVEWDSPEGQGFLHWPATSPPSHVSLGWETVSYPAAVLRKTSNAAETITGWRCG